MDIKISPSVLAADYAQLGYELKKCKEYGVDLIHLDVMDGHFVPNISIGPPVIASLKKVSNIPFDVHLMITDPYKYVKDFVIAGADLITFHIESNSNVKDTIDLIKSFDCKVGLAVKPQTPITEIYPYINDIDMVLVMTVEPGFGGQSFMYEMMSKVKQVYTYCKEKDIKMDIQVDGGITVETIGIASSNGANVFVAGSSIFNAPIPSVAIERLIENANNGRKVL